MLRADSGAYISVLRRHGGWRLNSVAEGYVKNVLQNKVNISKQTVGKEKNTVYESSFKNWILQLSL